MRSWAPLPVLGLCALVAAARPASGGVNAWTTIGPAPTMLSLAADPGPPLTLWASNLDALWRSSDRGAVWEPVPAIGGRIWTWAIAPTQPRVVYAGDVNSVWFSNDGGDTWVPRDPVTDDRFLGSIAVDPKAPLTLYATVNWVGVFRSTDGGAHWTPARAGLPDYIDRIWIVAPASGPSILYVETFGSLYRSVDGGAHWEPLPLFTAGVTPLATDPRSPMVLHTCAWVGADWSIAHSSDGGTTWTHGMGTCPPGLSDLVADPFDGQRMWGNSRSKPFVSRDAGEHWYALDRGMAADDLALVPRVVTDPAIPGRLYAATGRGGIMAYDDRCGNGVLDEHEECDDGNGVPGDGCRPDCSREAHGDGVLDVDEECDDRNFTDGDGCDSNFTRTRCGNGIVTAGEECDDGNDDQTDHCQYCHAACVTDAECDDGVSCTIDICFAGYCGWRFPVGFRERVAAVVHAVDALSAAPATRAERDRQRRTLSQWFRALLREVTGLERGARTWCARDLRHRLHLARAAVRLSWFGG